MKKNTQNQSSTSPRHFKQMTHPMRQLIEKGRKQKVPFKKIAQRLEVHPSTIYRELKRGQVTHINSQLEQYTTYFYAARAYLINKGGDVKVSLRTL